MDSNKREQVGNALNANGANLNCPPVLQSLGNTDQSSVDEMDVLDWLVSTVEFLPPDQTHWFGNPQYAVQCRRRQRKQKAIVDAPTFVAGAD
jgi:hypothetical protein